LSVLGIPVLAYAKIMLEEKQKLKDKLQARNNRNIQR
jgi:hypothetical protein